MRNMEFILDGVETLSCAIGIGARRQGVVAGSFAIDDGWRVIDGLTCGMMIVYGCFGVKKNDGERTIVDEMKIGYGFVCWHCFGGGGCFGMKSAIGIEELSETWT